MFVVYRKLAVCPSRLNFTRLSTLLHKPPTPSRDRIRTFLDNLTPKLIQNSHKKAHKIQKIQILNSQIKDYESELEDLRILTESNPELSEIGQQDSDTISHQINTLYGHILSNLYELIQDNFPNECIMEIRAAAGGAEAALFARDIYNMYVQMANKRRWILNEFDSNTTVLGGVKFVSFCVEGDSCFESLRFEGGVHRVQRIPYTSGAGKIHTSTVTVAVLSVPKEEEIVLDPGDIRIEAVRATGAGGQYVNTTDSAVRVTHIPTGLIVSCQMRRSQIQNKEKALEMLRAKLFDLKNNKIKNERQLTRRSQLGYGDRSEKIRTYNFPDDRITDHRIGVTLKGVSSYLAGNLSDEFNSKLSEVTKEILLDELLQSGTS